MGALLNAKWERFCVEYAKTNHATNSARAAGYTEKTLHVQAWRMLKNEMIVSRIDELRFPETNKNIADVAEIMEFLSKSMRGEIEDDVVVIEATGDYCTQAKNMKKPLSHAGRMKAGELLGKARKMFTDQVELSGAVVVFKNEPCIDD